MIDLPDVIELELTQEDIDKSKTRSYDDLCAECSVGRALNRKFPQYYCAAYNTDVGIYSCNPYSEERPHDFSRMIYNMDEVGCHTVWAYNENRFEDIKPCTITLTRQ